MFCKKCGNVVAKYDRICPHCGNNLALPSTPEQEAKYTKNLIITGIIITLMTIFVVGFMGINFDKEETEIPLSGVKANIEYKNKLYAYWIEKIGDNIIELNEDGSFVWYKNKNDMDNNFVKGFFSVENGCRFDKDIIYEYDGYLFYEVTFTNMKVMENGVDITEQLTDIQTTYIFRLEKENKATGTLVGLGVDEIFELVNSKNVATAG